MEIWKEIRDGYEVSNYGNIRSLDHYVNHRYGQRVVKGRTLKKVNHTQGYDMINMGSEYRDLVHRLVATAFIPNPENKQFVNHKDGNKKNNHVDNLEWVTRLENETHAYSTGLKNSTGSKNTMAKINEEDVKEIKSLFLSGKSSYELANVYGIHRATVERIVNNKIWKHVA